MSVNSAPEDLLRWYNADQILQFLLVTDVGDCFKDIEIKVEAFSVLSFFETRFQDSKEVLNYLLFFCWNRQVFRLSLGWENLFDSWPEPTELLIADASIRIKIDDGVNALHLVSSKGKGLISRATVDPEGSKGKVVTSSSQNIKYLVLVLVAVSLVKILKQLELARREFIEKLN